MELEHASLLIKLAHDWVEVIKCESIVRLSLHIYVDIMYNLHDIVVVYIVSHQPR